MTLLTRTASSGNGCDMETWYLAAPNAGTSTLALNFGGSYINYNYSLMCFSGVNQSTPIQAWNVSTSGILSGGVSNWTTTLSTQNSNDLISDYLTVGSSMPTVTLGVGQVQDYSASGNPASDFGDEEFAATAGTYSLTYGFSYPVVVVSQAIEINADCNGTASRTLTLTPTASPTSSPTGNPNAAGSNTLTPSLTPSVTSTMSLTPTPASSNSGACFPSLVAGSVVNGAGNSNSLSLQYTVGTVANPLLVLRLNASCGTVVSSVSYGAQNMTLLTRSGTSGGGCDMETWYLAGPVSGSGTLTLDWGGAYINYNYSLMTYGGVDQTNPIGAWANASSNLAMSAGTTWTTNLTTLNSNDLISDYLTLGTSLPTVSLGSGQVQEYTSTGNPSPNFGDEEQSTSAGSYSLTYTFSYPVMVGSQVIELNGACGGASPTPTPSPSPTISPTAVPVSQDCAFIVTYLAGSSVNSAVAQPLINISNNSAQSLSLSALVIEYWMAGSPANLSISASTATLMPEGTDDTGNMQVELRAGYSSGLMTIVQISFGPEAVLAPGENVNLSASIVSTSGSTWNQSADPSYLTGNGQYAVNPQLPVYCHGYIFQGNRPSAGSCLSSLQTNPSSVDFLCVLWGIQQNLDQLREAAITSTMTAILAPQPNQSPFVEQLYLRQPFFVHVNPASSASDIFIRNAENLVIKGSAGYHCIALQPGEMTTTFVDWIPPKRVTKPFDVFWPLTFTFESWDQSQNIATWKANVSDGVMYISVSLATPLVQKEVFVVQGTSGREKESIEGLQYGTVQGITVLQSVNLVHRAIAGNGAVTLDGYGYSYDYTQVNEILPESLFQP